MKDGTLLLQKPNWELGKSLQDRVIRVIQGVTGSKYHHVVVFLDGGYWESTVWFVGGKMCSGVKKSKREPYFSTVLEPTFEIEKWQVDWIKKYFLEEMEAGRPYNFGRLAVLAVVYPFRWLWKAIGWVPFSRRIFGEVCSTFIDEALEMVGIDVLPDQLSGYTAPVDFLRGIETGMYRQAFM